MADTKSAVKFKSLLGDRILVLPDEAQKKTEGGILLPDTAVDRPRTGKVVASGPGEYNPHTSGYAAMSCKVGDRVMYTIYSKADVKVEGYDRDLVLMRQTEVIGVIE